MIRKKVIIGLLAVVAAGTVGAVSYKMLYKRQAEDKEQKYETVKEQVRQLERKKDVDGIIRETSGLYLTEKQGGYRYREPETISYPSKITGTNRHAMVFLPADYKEDKQYPVKTGRENTAVAGNSMGGRNRKA